MIEFQFDQDLFAQSSWRLVFDLALLCTSLSKSLISWNWNFGLFLQSNFKVGNTTFNSVCYLHVNAFDSQLKNWQTHLFMEWRTNKCLEYIHSSPPGERHRPALKISKRPKYKRKKCVTESHVFLQNVKWIIFCNL